MQYYGFYLHSNLIFHCLHVRVLGTAETDREIVQPPPTPVILHHGPGEVVPPVVHHQAHHGQEQAQQPDVPAVVVTLQYGVYSEVY